MRLLGTALALLSLLVPAGGQQDFSDPDFDLRMTVPVGMAETPREHAAAAFGSDLETFNTPRAEKKEGAPLTHRFLWHDLTGRERSMRLIVEENPNGPPFGSSADVKKFAEDSTGFVIDHEEPLKIADGYRVGVLVEGQRERASDGALMRGLVAYFPAPPKRYVMVICQALSTDWDLMRPDFMAGLASLDFPQELAPPDKARAASKAGGGGGAAAPRGETERWDSLHVAGSLALSVVLLLSLFLGGHART